MCKTFNFGFGVFVVCVAVVVYGNVINLNDENGIALQDNGNSHVEHMDLGPSVHHYARHGVCHSTGGKMHFYKALSDHLRDVSDDLKFSLLIDICDRKDVMLDKWVAEIYDTNRDGFISHSEKVFYGE